MNTSTTVILWFVKNYLKHLQHQPLLHFVFSAKMAACIHIKLLW